MKKVLALLLVLGMVLGMCACGGGGGGKTKEIKGETFDTGEFSVLVPEGWLKYDVTFQGDLKTDQLQLYKGAKSEEDFFTTPYISIKYFDEKMPTLEDMVKYYDESEMLDDVTIGDVTWEAASATFVDKQIILKSESPAEFAVYIAVDVNGNTISLDDADVQAIIKSLTVTAK